jgi:hypothetical protein
MRHKKRKPARLVHEIGAILILALQGIKLIIEIVNKVANCHDRELQIQISNARKTHFCAERVLRATG